MNKALKLSCTRGLPVRVVRSFKVCGGERRAQSSAGGKDGIKEEQGSSGLAHQDNYPLPFLDLPLFLTLLLLPPSLSQEKRSSYAPTSETPVRYDGVYRILRCWRKPGNQKQLMCRCGSRAGSRVCLVWELAARSSSGAGVDRLLDVGYDRPNQTTMSRRVAGAGPGSRHGGLAR